MMKWERRKDEVIKRAGSKNLLTNRSEQYVLRDKNPFSA